MNADPLTLKLGDRFTVVDVDGIEHHDTVHSIRYRSAQPEIRQQPTGWRRILRNLTPPRWRKPLPIARPYRAADIEIIGVSEKARRAHRMAEDMLEAVNRLLDRLT